MIALYIVQVQQQQHQQQCWGYRYMYHYHQQIILQTNTWRCALAQRQRLKACGNMTRPRQGERGVHIQYFVINLKRQEVHTSNRNNHSRGGCFMYDKPSAVRCHINWFYTYGVYVISTCDGKSVSLVVFFWWNFMLKFSNIQMCTVSSLSLPPISPPFNAINTGHLLCTTRYHVVATASHQCFLTKWPPHLLSKS